MTIAELLVRLSAETAEFHREMRRAEWRRILLLPLRLRIPAILRFWWDGLKGAL